jgi:hypothetical protein
MDSKGTGQEETQENRQDRKQSPEQAVEVNHVWLFSIDREATSIGMRTARDASFMSFMRVILRNRSLM